MAIISATEARNHIGKLWEAAAAEPVTVQKAGKAIAVVLSPAEFEKLSGQRRPRQAGFAKHLLAGIDVDALLATPLTMCSRIICEADLNARRRLPNERFA